MALSRFSRYIYIFGLCLFAAALPLSKSFLTISQIVLVLSWALNVNYKEKLKLFMENRILWWFPLLLILHFVFLINTEDVQYAWHDINIKLPLFVVPFVVATTIPPNKKELRSILGFFCAAVFAGAVIVIGKYIASEMGWIEEVLEHRLLSSFTSHIRFSLMMCFSIALLSFAFKEKMISGALCLLNATALIICMILLESITGLLTLGIIALPLLMLFIDGEYKKHLKKIIALFLFMAVVVGSYFYYEINDIFVVKSKQDAFANTPSGNPYYNDVNNPATENGYYLWRNVCEKEMEEAWDKKSEFEFASSDKKGQELKITLLRYLTSLGLKKDAQGMAQLSAEDIVNIENGEANAVNSNSNPVRKRIRELLREIAIYSNGEAVNNSSLTQRFIYWKTGLEIISENYLWGVGTGDVQNAFNAQYDKDQSTLTGDLRRHTHNQYLTFWISFGIAGFLFFLLLFFSLYHYTSVLEYPFLAKIFLVIVLLSMLSEDTLETQAGVSFFVFFFALFWVGKKSS
jgi:hypothetical protein